MFPDKATLWVTAIEDRQYKVGIYYYYDTMFALASKQKFRLLITLRSPGPKNKNHSIPRKNIRGLFSKKILFHCIILIVRLMHFVPFLLKLFCCQNI